MSYTNDPSNPGAPTIIEENNYYPFGLKHKGYNHGTSSLGNSVAQRWKYNGKEYDESLDINTYDFGARNYNPAIGRWMNVDPLAEERQGLSPYNFVQNNPINRIDPDGALDMSVQGPDDWVLGKDGKYTWDANVTSATDADLNGREYIGKSINDVSSHFKENNPISSLFNDPEMGDTSTWPGEIMAHENTVFEDARDFGVENNIPGSETAYEILDDVSVFVTSFDLLNPKGQPLHLDGSVSTRGSSDHID